jgi:hypothetical protein
MATKINPEQRQKKVSSLLKDFYALDGINVSKNEAEKMVSREPTETVYELTQKALDMATKLMEAKGVQNMMSNPIMSSATKSRNDIAMNPRNTPDNEPAQPPKISSNKDANFSEVPPRVVRPLRMGDSIADILGKMYNFMIKKYDSDGVVFKDKQKYNLKLAAIKETRIQELISLFGGKYTKKTFGAQEEKKDSFFDKMLKYVIVGAGLLFLTEAAFASVEKKIKDTLPEIPDFLSIFGLSSTDLKIPGGYNEKIAKVESDNNPNQMNITNKETGNTKKGTSSSQVIPGNIDITTGKPYTKYLTDMTMDEVVKLGERRNAKLNGGGAAGLYQFEPKTLAGLAPQVFGKDWKNLKFNEENQEKLMDAFTAGNIKSLKNANIPVNEQSLYQMHFTGNTEQTKKIQQSPNDTPMSSILGKKATEQNQRIASQTVDQYKSGLEKQGFSKTEITSPMLAAPKPIEIPDKAKVPAPKENTGQQVSVLNRNINNINNVTYGSEEGAVEHSPLIQRQYYS